MKEKTKKRIKIVTYTILGIGVTVALGAVMYKNNAACRNAMNSLGLSIKKALSDTKKHIPSQSTTTQSETKTQPSKKYPNFKTKPVHFDVNGKPVTR